MSNADSGISHCVHIGVSMYIRKNGNQQARKRGKTQPYVNYEEKKLIAPKWRDDLRVSKQSDSASDRSQVHEWVGHSNVYLPMNEPIIKPSMSVARFSFFR